MGEERGDRFSGALHAPLPRRLRGYDVEATDALIDELSAGRRRLESECVVLRQQVATLEAALDRVRERVSKALIAASAHARAVHDRAQQEAESILQNARDQADKLTEGADRIDLEWDDAQRDLPLQALSATRAWEAASNGLVASRDGAGVRGRLPSGLGRLGRQDDL